MRNPSPSDFSAHQSASQFIHANPQGHVFTTHDIRASITGSLQVDIGTPVNQSLNVRLGKWLMRDQKALGIEQVAPAIKVCVNGRQTTSSIWRKR